MTQNTISPHLSLSLNQKAARMVVIFSTTFIAILFLLHFLEPEFDPSWRMISEYELGRFGWMMSLAFFCWGGSVFALLITLWSSLRTLGGTLARGWLILLGVALFGAGIFKTNPIMDTTVSTANTLHSLCGALVIITFPIVASLISGSLSRNPKWVTAKRQLFWMTLLVWFSMFAFFGSIIISQAMNPAAGRVGPDVLLGWPNRFLVVAYNVWLIIVARRAQSQ